MTNREYRKFMGWWRRMKSFDAERHEDEINKWLHYAAKTVSLRGDQNQQRVVYTIKNRVKRSQYPIKRHQAQTVWAIVNQKQDMYKRLRHQLEMEYAQNRRSPVIVKTINRRKISG